MRALLDNRRVPVPFPILSVGLLVSVDPNPRGPARLLLINVYSIGEGVRLACGDGGYVVLVGVDKGDYLHDRCHEGLAHGLPDFGSFCRCKESALSWPALRP